MIRVGVAGLLVLAFVFAPYTVPAAVGWIIPSPPPLFADETTLPDPSTLKDVAALFGTGFIGSILVWYLWHTTVKTLPTKDTTFTTSLEAQRAFDAKMGETERTFHSEQVDKVCESLKGMGSEVRGVITHCAEVNARKARDG